MGATGKLDHATHTRIVDAIRAGSYLNHAAAFAGINNDTLHEWLGKGRRSTQGRYREFFLAVEAARGEAAVRAGAQLQLAMRGGQVVERTTVTRVNGDRETREKYAPIDTNAIKFFLTAGPPRDEWRNANDVHVSGPGGGPIPIQATTEALADKVRAFRARLADDDAEDAEIVEGQVVAEIEG